MSYYEIPLTCAPNCTRSFTITLAGGDGEKVNKKLQLRLRYLDRYDVWLGDVTDLATDAILVAGVPMVPGVNLLGQLGYFGAGEAYIEPVLPTDLEQPDNKTLGQTFVLIWGDSSE